MGSLSHCLASRQSRDVANLRQKNQFYDYLKNVINIGLEKHFFKQFDLLDKTLPIPPVSNFYVDKVAPSETALAIKIQYQLILFYFQMASAMERPMLRISQARSKDLISVSQVRFLTASYAQRS